jgi:hypothetical protein
MTELEGQLRSWVPRPPSAALRQRIFAPASVLRPTRHAPPTTRHVAKLALAWLVPATAALVLLGLLAAQQPHPALSHPTHSGALLALALSNQNAGASFSAALSNEQYALPAGSLASTNLRPLTSSFSPRSLSSRTN